MDLNNKVVLVTGASGGIGEVIARRLAREGARVLVAARSRDRLDRIAESIRAGGGEAYPFTVDLLDEKSREVLLDRVYAAFGTIDVLVNNAGFGWYGYGYDMELNDSSDMVDLNVKAVVHLTLTVLKRMKERKSGHIINMGSIAGSLPIQGIALYGASKAFVENFSEALFREMRGSGVHVSVIKPGAVRTEFFKQAEARTHGSKMPALRGMDPERIASKVVGLLNKPRKVIVIPKILGVLPFVDWLFGWVIDLIGPLLLKKNQNHA
jgi:uncharacterized protein